MNVLLSTLGFVLMIVAGGSEGPYFPYLNVFSVVVGIALFTYFGNKALK